MTRKQIKETGSLKILLLFIRDSFVKINIFEGKKEERKRKEVKEELEKERKEILKY